MLDADSDVLVLKGDEFLFFLLALPKITMPASSSDVRASKGDELWCSAIGPLPIFIAITWNSTVLVNTTSIGNIVLCKEGNYSCVATNKFGNDTRFISVTFGKTLL